MYLPQAIRTGRGASGMWRGYDGQLQVIGCPGTSGSVVEGETLDTAVSGGRRCRTSGRRRQERTGS
jgi:hypothetical protein